MLLYTRRAPTKPPKRRSRAGCIHCKEKKKKCNEERPSCDRCIERGLDCEYEPIKPRKRRRTISPNGAASGTIHVSPVSSMNHGFNSRLQAFRQTPLSGLSTSSLPPAPTLDAIAEGWEVHSAFEDSQGYGDFFSDSSVSPFDPMEPFAAPKSQNSSVDSMDALLKEVPRLHSSHSTTPDIPTSAAIAPTSTSFQPPSTTAPAGATIILPELDDFTHFSGLLEYFRNELAPLFAFRTSSNPFTDLLLPLAHHNLVLLNALYAISSAHLENLARPVDHKSLDWHSKAIQGLATSIGLKDPDDEDSTLAATLVLLYYEVVRNSSSVVLRSHLNGGLSMLHGRLAPRTSTTVFLERAFRYFDVMSALSSGRAPIEGSLLPTPNMNFSPTHEPYPAPSVDPIFGLTSNLWPIMHRLAELVDMKREIAEQSHSRESAMNMQCDLDSRAANVELFLQQWRPELPPPRSPESSPGDSHLQSMLSHAEACKQAALIHLHVEVYGHPSTALQIQVPVKQALQACLRVLMFAGSAKGLFWPLFTAAVHAVDQIDMEVARTCFNQLEKKQCMQSIVIGWEVCEEVWKRQTPGEECMGWRQVAEDMGREIIFT